MYKNTGFHSAANADDCRHASPKLFAVEESAFRSNTLGPNTIKRAAPFAFAVKKDLEKEFGGQWLVVVGKGNQLYKVGRSPTEYSEWKEDYLKDGMYLKLKNRDIRIILGTNGVANLQQGTPSSYRHALSRSESAELREALRQSMKSSSLKYHEFENEDPELQLALAASLGQETGRPPFKASSSVYLDREIRKEQDLEFFQSLAIDQQKAKVSQK